MLLLNPSNQFTGVVFNAEDKVIQTDSNSVALNGFSRAQVLNFVATTANWKLIGLVK